MNFCAKCGSQLKPDARFCGRCGEIINQTRKITTSETFQNPLVKDFSSGYTQSNPEFRMANSQQRIVRLWYILGMVFLFCVFLPSIIGLDGFNGGFFISFMAGFCVIMSIVVIFIYRSRAKQLERILGGEGRIAVWNYTTDEWKRFVTKDFEEDKKLKRMLFFLVSGISVVIGVILTINFQDPIFIPIILGIIVVVAIPAIWAPRYRFRKLQHSRAQALIAENGVIIGKMFHLWVKLGARLDQVLFNSEENPGMIEFTYSMPTRNGREQQVARVPVPNGNQQEAMRIVDYFNSHDQ